MAQIPYRANLAADDFPLLTSLKGQTVIIGKFDQDFELDTGEKQKLTKEKQIPDAYFVENVIPTGEGYQSIGYTTKVPGLAAASDFNRCFTLRDINENKVFYSPSYGKNYVFDRNLNNIWRSIAPIKSVENAAVTIAYLNGETYIFFQKNGCYRYDKATFTFVSVVLIGLVVANINGICSANGFLLAWDDANVIYRSQANSPLDFTPDPSLGSGAGVPQDIRGKIVTVLPISNGFVVYTTANAVGATFQQNIRYPFVFKEIEGTTGIISADHVSWQDNLGAHFVWSKSGLLRVDKSKAAPIFPKITDFLTAKLFETYNYATDVFTIAKLSNQLTVRVTSIGSKYLVISYGTDPIVFSHALIYDFAFKRFGKLKIDHVDCFNFYQPNLGGDITWNMFGDLTWTDLGETTWAQLGVQLQTNEIAKEIVGFLKSDGTISIINFDLTRLTGDNGVVLLGKYQFSRSNLLSLDEIAVENIDQGSDFQVKVLTSYDGKTIGRITTPFKQIDTGQFRNYLCDATGINHSIAFKGTFNIISTELTMHPHGRA